MTTTQIPPVVSTRIDHLCRNSRCVNPNHLEAVAAITRTDLLATFEAFTDAEYRLDSASPTWDGTDTERAEYMVAFRAHLDTYRAMIDAIAALDIPA